MGSMAGRAQIIVRGIVQGVGFRPYVFNLAESLGLKGCVANTGEGVLIDIEGEFLSEFIRRLPLEAPPLSRITDIVFNNLPFCGHPDFSISESSDHAVRQPFTLVSPDTSVCDQCLSELLDPSNRRYLYPFINCTNCGPRYSITSSVPYDRPNTTMAPFTMCPDCLNEYQDPRNRRFHAQPNACPVCGPAVEFRVFPPSGPLPSGERESQKEHPLPHGERRIEVRGSEAVQECILLMQQGGIVAVKGLGGFHIACDAANDGAVRRLREKKRKSNKPFAVMAPSIAAADMFCVVSDAERNLLLSNRRPVVLLEKKPGELLSEAVSPNNRFIGVMLPYTPLHYLLFHHPILAERQLTDPHFTALVMTSGNLSEEPIVRDNVEAVKKLADIVDGFLLHNRDIFMRVDDSVVRPSFVPRSSSVSFLRRSRGYAPEPIELHDDGPEVLGCGADLKNTFTITKGKFAIPGQHIGDMENYETARFFEESLENIKAVYRADPKIIAHDLHPGYLSTRWALEHGAADMEPGARICGIQHHYAHIGSVMAEHGLKNKVIGVAFDGTGYGTDGNLWGGEFLIADSEGFERAGHFAYVRLPGGEAAIREPWRTAVSFIMMADGDTWDSLERAGFVERYGSRKLKQVIKVAKSPELSPLASGAGRLFDAVSALLGVCDTNTFEGEAATALESFTADGIEGEYPFELSRENEYTAVNFTTMITALINDLTHATPREVISTKFHNTVVSAIRAMVDKLSSDYGIRDIALSGGTFQNLYLLRRTVDMLTSKGMQVFLNQKVPCNDGGISLGQAHIVRERINKFGSYNPSP